MARDVRTSTWWTDAPTPPPICMQLCDEEKPAAQAQAGLEYREYCLPVAADRRARPAADDLMSVLVHAEIHGERRFPPFVGVANAA